jgi:hypothetical protein
VQLSSVRKPGLGMRRKNKERAKMNQINFF